MYFEVPQQIRGFPGATLNGMDDINPDDLAAPAVRPLFPIDSLIESSMPPPPA